MPTRHRRINVTCDPELTSALEATRAQLGEDMPDAQRLRELALLGARALRTREGAAARGHRDLSDLIPGYVPPSSFDLDLPWLRERPSAAGSEALAWVRGDER